MGDGNQAVEMESRRHVGGFRQGNSPKLGEGKRERSQKNWGFWPGGWEPMMLSSEVRKKRSKCWWQEEKGTFCFEYVEFGVPSSYARSSWKWVSALLFLLTLSLMNKWELDDPELYFLLPNIKHAPKQWNAFKIWRQYQYSHVLRCSFWWKASC